MRALIDRTSLPVKQAGKNLHNNKTLLIFLGLEKLMFLEGKLTTLKEFLR